jgi:hypothetical protein
VHRDVGHIDVLHDVILSGILAQGTDADAVRSIAPERLHEDVGGVGLEGDAICRERLCQFWPCESANVMV